MEVDLKPRSNKKMKTRYRRNPQVLYQEIREEGFSLRYRVTDQKKDYSALADPHASYYFSSPSVKDHLKRYRRAVRVEEPNQTNRKSLKKLLTVRINEKFTNHISPNIMAYEKNLTSLELETLNKKSSNSLHKKSKRSLSSNHSNQNLTSHGFSVKKQPLDATLSHQLNPSATTQYPKIDSKEEGAKGKQKPKKQKDCIITPRISTHLKQHRGKEKTIQDRASQDQNGRKLRTKTLSKDKQGQASKLNRLTNQLHKKKHDKWLKFLQEKKQMLAKLRDLPNNPESS